MSWIALFHEAFEPEFDGLPEDVQNEILAHAKLLEHPRAVAGPAAACCSPLFAAT